MNGRFHLPHSVAFESGLKEQASTFVFAGSGGPPANNAFDMSGMNQSLDLMSSESAKPKSAADFLGANANLVNLDNLVTKPAPGPSEYHRATQYKVKLRGPETKPIWAQVSNESPRY